MIFKDVLGYENLYRISPSGDVYSYEKKWITGRGNGRPHTQKAKKVSPFTSKHGYLRINLWKNNKSKKHFVHVLVASVYCNNKKHGLQVNHIDGNKKNNHFSNLEWVTASENLKHAFRIGLKKINKNTKDALSRTHSGGLNKKAKKVLNISTGEIYSCIKEAAEKNKIKPHNLYVYLRGVVKNKTNLKYA